MKLFLAICLLVSFATCSFGQILKTLSYNTTNGRVAYSGTNTLTFTNNVAFSSSAVFGSGISINYNEIAWESGILFDLETRRIYNDWIFESAPMFGNAAGTRTNLGLGASNTVRFGSILLYQDGEVTNAIGYSADTLNFSQNGVTFFSLDSADGGTVIFNKPISFAGTNTIANTANTRTNLGLADAQIAAHFPSESDGMRKIRYPNGILPSTAPTSLPISSNTASLLPFFVDRPTTNFAAILPSYSTVLPVTVQVAVYNASGGLRTATLVGTSSVTIISNTSPALNRVVEFTNQAKTLDRGWYVLSALYTGTNILTNGTVFVIQNLPMFGGPTNILSSVIGSSSPQVLIATNLTSFPASLTNIAASGSTGVLVYALPLY